MAVEQPAAGDKLNSPDHSLLHRIIATDASADTESISVNASSVSTIKSLVATTADINGGTMDGVQVGGTTATGELLVNNSSDAADGLGDQGSDGEVLTSAGAGVNPTWEAAAIIGARGTFVDGDLSSSILTITHSKGLSTPFTLNLTITDNSQEQIIPDSVTFTTNTIVVDLSSYGTLTGTWGYYYA